MCDSISRLYLGLTFCYAIPILKSHAVCLFYVVCMLFMVEGWDWVFLWGVLIFLFYCMCCVFGFIFYWVGVGLRFFVLLVFIVFLIGVFFMDGIVVWVGLWMGVFFCLSFFGGYVICLWGFWFYHTVFLFCMFPRNVSFGGFVVVPTGLLMDLCWYVGMVKCWTLFLGMLC